MKVTTVAQTGVGQSSTIPTQGADVFNVGFGVVVSGTVTYTVQHTFDGVNYFNHEDLVDKVDNQDGNYAFPVANIRLDVTAGAGTATLTSIQAVR